MVVNALEVITLDGDYSRIKVLRLFENESDGIEEDPLAITTLIKLGGQISLATWLHLDL